MSKAVKKVYVGMAADIIHEGHLKIIAEARKYGYVIVGLLTDEAIASYKRIPYTDYDHRKIIVENLKGVDEVVPQKSLDYVPNLQKIRPDFLVHGDDWQTGIQKKTRQSAIDALKKWNGKLIEPKYTKGISSSQLIEAVKKRGITPDMRLKSLRLMLSVKPTLRVMETHNGITGLIIEKTKVHVSEGVREFDALWLSSLTVSTSKGKPDTELVDFYSRFQTVEEILEVTTKPIIIDGDTGGEIEHFQFNVRTMERLGVSAVIIEDKIGLKRNSLFGTDVFQEQDSIEHFSEKIRAGKDALITDDFMIFARIESLILNNGMDDALKRAKAYISAGADGIMIHSKKKDGQEIIDFCKSYQKFDVRVPLVVVPSTFSHMSVSDFKELGVQIVIYGNHLIRSAYPAMVKTAESILKHDRGLEASDDYCISIKEVLELIPENK